MSKDSCIKTYLWCNIINLQYFKFTWQSQTQLLLETKIRLLYRECIVVRMLLLTTLLLASSTRALEDMEKSSCCESITLSSGGMGDFYQVSSVFWSVGYIFKNSLIFKSFSIGGRWGGGKSIFSDASPYTYLQFSTILFLQSERLGLFVRSGSSSSGRGIYTQSQGDNYLFYLVGWVHSSNNQVRFTQNTV